ncbi:hypothetical protein PIB30_065301 [Stylosanthes scabra]|uniref:Uncharacterized protein n=1 Tax=Stylosanthes scabra TaxID=79078 RepID=A0ABU6TLT0_9FABA|nr:hypothetical protein [Stylosanthes scabra]
MSDPNRTSKAASAAVGRRQVSRLQSSAPSSLQINRTAGWNTPIPLLSPLESCTQPVAAKVDLPQTAQAPSQQQRRQGAEPEKVAFKKWQQPPFCYEHASSGIKPFC